MNIGQRDCAFARWLEFHAGQHGTGFRRRATAVPLATGAAVHTGLELIGKWILDWQRAHTQQRLITVPDEVIAWGASEAAIGYERRARARGLELTKTDVDSAAAIDLLIREQATLIEAQVWIYAIVRLPYMLSRCVLIDVEREEAPVVDCTCGLGDWVGEVEVHAARQCRGIVAMGKADFLWEVVGERAIEYEEFKTKATSNYGWDMSWEHSGQLFRNMEAASRRLGRDVSTAYVPVLYKGKRDRVDRDDKSQPKIQQSPLVYGWYDPGNGMTRGPEWAARYKWIDDYGKWHTLPRTYKRQGIWDESVPLGDVPPLMLGGDNLNPNGVAKRPGASRVEQWVKGWITPMQHYELLKVLGPFPKPTALVEEYTQAMLTEERRWRGDVAYLRAAGVYQPSDRKPVQQYNGGEGLVSTPGEIIHVDAAQVISRSWNCTRFDGSSCMFKPVCHKLPGWQDMTTMLSADGAPMYEIRTPHHSTEQTAYEAMGLQFPEQDEDDDE